MEEKASVPYRTMETDIEIRCKSYFFSYQSGLERKGRRETVGRASCRPSRRGSENGRADQEWKSHSGKIFCQFGGIGIEDRLRGGKRRGKLDQGQLAVRQELDQGLREGRALPKGRPGSEGKKFWGPRRALDAF